MRVERGVIDKPRYTKDLQGVSYVMGDVGERPSPATRHLVDSPLYGLFAIRGKLADAALPGTGGLGEYWIRQPATRTASTRSSGTASGRSPTRPSATWARPTASA